MTTTKKKIHFFFPTKFCLSCQQMIFSDSIRITQKAPAARAFMQNQQRSAWAFCFLLHLLQRAELGQANMFSTGTRFPIEKDIQNLEVTGTITGVRDSNTSYKETQLQTQEVHKLSEIPYAHSPERVQRSTSFFFFKLGLK